MKKIIIFCFVIFLYFSVNAEELNQDNNIIKLDIGSAIAKAVEHNFSLKNNILDNDSNLLSAYTFWNKFLPSTNLSASIGNNYTYKTVTDEKTNIVTNSEDTTKTLSLGFNISLTLGAKMFFEIRQTISDYNNGMINYQIALNKLKVSIKKFYYNLIILKEQMDLENNKLENAKRRLDATMIKYRIGVASEIDKLQSEYDYKSILFENKKANDSYDSNIFELKQMLGIDPDKKIELTSNIPEATNIDYNELKKLSAGDNLDIQLIQQQLISEQNTRDQYIASLTPSISFSYSASTSFNKDPLSDQWFNDLKDDWDKSGTFKFSVSVPIDPLFPFSSVQNNIIKGQLSIKKIENSLEDQKEKNKLSITQSIINLGQTKEDISTLSANIDLADNTYKQIEKLYNAGGKSFLDLKDAENNLFDAQIKLLNAKYNYLTNLLDLNYLLNIDEKKGVSYEKK